MSELLIKMMEQSSNPLIADRTAVIGGAAADSESFSYLALFNKATAAAEELKAHGAQCVALYADNSPNWVVVDLACQLAGIPLLPLPLYFSDQQLIHAINTCNVDLVLTDNTKKLKALLPQAKANNQTVANFNILARALDQTQSLPKNTSKITFTSGSTGEPKGVCLNSTSQFSVASSLVDAIDMQSVRHLCVLPLTTLLENVAGVYGPLLAGGEIVIPPLQSVGFNGSASFDLRQFLGALNFYKPQSIILIPQILTALIAAVESGYQAPATLKFIAVGGAKVSPEILHKAQQLGLPVFEGYGLSECASVVSLNVPNNNKPGTTGTILKHHKVSFKDGELVVTSHCFLGYAGKPETWYPHEVNTGDLASLDDEGYLSLKGRSKHLLISSFGRNISPEWIESEILANLQIKQAIVIGDDKPYCSALIFVDESQFSDSEIANWISKVNGKLPDYAKINNWQRLPIDVLTDNHLITDNGRPKRNLITQFFEHDIDNLYLLQAMGN